MVKRSYGPRSKERAKAYLSGLLAGANECDGAAFPSDFAVAIEGDRVLAVRGSRASLSAVVKRYAARRQNLDPEDALYHLEHSLGVLRDRRPQGSTQIPDFQLCLWHPYRIGESARGL